MGINGEIPAKAMLGVGTVINLVGESVADRSWSRQHKARMRESRIKSTEALLRAIRANPVDLVLQASAIGYYGFSGEGRKTEEAASGEGFLASLSRDWEEAAKPMSEIARLVQLRIGLVLGWEGGAFPKLDEQLRVWCDPWLRSAVDELDSYR